VCLKVGSGGADETECGRVFQAHAASTGNADKINRLPKKTRRLAKQTKAINQ